MSTIAVGVQVMPIDDVKDAITFCKQHGLPVIFMCRVRWW